MIWSPSTFIRNVGKIKRSSKDHLSVKLTRAAEVENVRYQSTRLLSNYKPYANTQNEVGTDSSTKGFFINSEKMNHLQNSREIHQKFDAARSTKKYETCFEELEFSVSVIKLFRQLNIWFGAHKFRVYNTLTRFFKLSLRKLVLTTAGSHHWTLTEGGKTHLLWKLHHSDSNDRTEQTHVCEHL